VGNRPLTRSSVSVNAGVMRCFVVCGWLSSPAGHAYMLIEHERPVGQSPPLSDNLQQSGPLH